MQKAGDEERQLAIQNGEVDVDGIPMCTVIADGQWSKRSYKSKYNALTGTERNYTFLKYYVINLHNDVQIVNCIKIIIFRPLLLGKELEKFYL